MEIFGITNVWLGKETVEITSTDDTLLDKLIIYIKDNLGIKTNKIELKKNKLRKLANITVVPLDETPNESFMFFWLILGYLCDNGWEPNNSTGDTFSFKIKYEDK